MTKTRKIICIALVVAMIAAAVFFAIYKKVGNKYDYAKIKDYSKYIKMGDIEGVTFNADDSTLEAPDVEDVRTKVAQTLRSYIEKDEDGNNVKVTAADAVIGEFDVVYVNYYGTYFDANNNVIYFTKGVLMDQDKPEAFYVNSGDSSLLFANELAGKSPNPDAYTLKATGAEGDDTAIEAGDVVYITYTWVRYPYVLDEDGNRVQEEGVDKVDAEAKQNNTQVDTTLVTDNFRLDLANVPAYFPAGFADQLVGKTVGALDAMTFEDVAIDDGEGGTTYYRYEYTVNVKRVIGAFTEINIDYTYPDDSEAKDIFGNELKGKDVTFHVVISYFNDVPTLDATYPESSEEGAKEISIILHDDKINFDKDSYFTEHDLFDDEEAWIASEPKDEDGNAIEATHENYIRYLQKWYELSVLEELQEDYDAERKEAAAKPMWEAFKALVTEVNAPEKALKVTKSDLYSQFKYIFNNTSFENDAGKTVSYRTQYGSFKKFMKACYNDDTVIQALGLDTNVAYMAAIEAGKSYSECVDDAALEIVTNKLMIYAAYDKLPEDAKYAESEFESQRNLMYFYYYYGLASSILPDSALRESLMFDHLLDYVYSKATVNWSSAEAPAPEAEGGENP